MINKQNLKTDKTEFKLSKKNKRKIHISDCNNFYQQKQQLQKHEGFTI